MREEFCPPLLLVTDHYEENSLNWIHRVTLLHVSSSVKLQLSCSHMFSLIKMGYRIMKLLKVIFFVTWC